MEGIGKGGFVKASGLGLEGAAEKKASDLVQSAKRGAVGLR